MICPSCFEETKVVDTRKQPNGEVRRKRVCGNSDCPQSGERFTTTERISAHDIRVTKRGQRPDERFSRTKLRSGIEKAASVWRFSPTELDAYVQRIVDRIRPSLDVPVSSADLGNLVLRVLESDKPTDHVTRIRFAIVFRGRSSLTTAFRTLDDFLSWLETEYPDLVPAGGPADISTVIKRDGQTVRFDLQRLERSIGIAAKGRGSDDVVRQLATSVAGNAVSRLQGQSIVSTQQIAAHVLEILARRDQLAYLRYASAVKRYGSVKDFWDEAMALKAIRS